MNSSTRKMPELDQAALQRAGKKIVVNGIELDVVVMGEGPDVLLVHGFPDDRSVWRKQIPALVAAGYRVIVPDTRGCGESDAPLGTRAYRIEEHMADLVGTLDALGVEKVKLIGHDWGAVLSWQFCMAHPERVERYAALSVGHPTAYAKGPLEQKIKGYYVFLIQLRGFIEWALRAGHWWLFRTIVRHAECDYYIQRLSRPGRLTAALNYYRANFAKLIFPPEYPSVAMPVLGIHSTSDNYLAARQMTDTARYVKGAFRYESIPGASHWLQLDAPEQVNALLLDFLQ